MKYHRTAEAGSNNLLFQTNIWCTRKGCQPETSQLAGRNSKKFHGTLNERKMVFSVVRTSRYFGSCCILPYPAVSCCIMPYAAVSCRIRRILPSSCHILPYSATSCLILPYPAVSCRILPYPAVSCRILPYPAVSCCILPSPAVSYRIEYAYQGNPNEDLQTQNHRG